MRTAAPRVDRREIRRAFVQALQDLGLEFGRRVSANRVLVNWPEDLTCCNVFTRTEQLEVEIETPRNYKRSLEVVVQLAAKAKVVADPTAELEQISDGLDDKLDGIAREIEERIERDTSLGGIVADVVHTRDVLEPVVEGSEQFAFMRMTFEVTYFTEAGERPESGVGPLRSIESTLRTEVPGTHTLQDRFALTPP